MILRFILLSLFFSNLAHAIQLKAIPEAIRNKVPPTKQYFGTCYAHAMSGMLNFSRIAQGHETNILPVDPFYLSLLSSIQEKRNFSYQSIEEESEYFFEGGNLYDMTDLLNNVIEEGRFATVASSKDNLEASLENTMKDLIDAWNGGTKGIESHITKLYSKMRVLMTKKFAYENRIRSDKTRVNLKLPPGIQSDEDIAYEKDQENEAQLQSLFAIINSSDAVTFDFLVQVVLDSLDPVKDYVLIQQVQNNAKDLAPTFKKKMVEDKLSLLLLLLYPPRTLISKYSFPQGQHFETIEPDRFAEALVRYFASKEEVKVPVLAGICSLRSIYRPKKKAEKEECGGHAILLLGLRKQDGEIQVLVRDSNGSCQDITQKGTNKLRDNFRECDSNGIDFWYEANPLVENNLGMIISAQDLL